MKKHSINTRPWQGLKLFALIMTLALLVCHACPSIAQTTPKPALLALSKADHILAIIDPVSLKILARVPVGPDPHEVIASADGKTAYVTNMGNGQSYEINVIDLTAQKALPNIDTRPLSGPHGIVFADGKVWFTAQDSKAVGRYDPSSAKMDWSMGTGQDRTHMIYVTADAKKVYTTNVSAGTVSILENVMQQPRQGPGGPPGGPSPAGGRPNFKPRMEWVQTVVSVSKGSEGFDVSSDGREIWTAASEDGVISIIDTGSRKVIASIDAKAIGANRLKFTPDGKRVFISSLRSGDVLIYDAATRKEVKRLSLGHGCAGIQMDPDGSRVFVASTGGDYIAVIDLKTLEVKGRVEISGPDGMAWSGQ